MRTTKLVTGILSIILSVFVLFQSCAAGTYNAMAGTGEVSGTGGAFVAIMLLAAGIVTIATRNKGKGGSIACAIMYGLGGLLGIISAGSYSDLYVWSALSLILMLLHMVSVIKENNK